MTKTDFAELKEKLCEFDILDSSDDFDEYVKQFPVVANNGYSRGITHSYWQTSARHQHTKSAAIISELIEIIEMQSEALESYAFRTQSHAVSTVVARNSIDQTTTRLQKLREGQWATETKYHYLIKIRTEKLKI